MYLPNLESVGLSKTENAVYSFLIDNGPRSAGEIIKSLSIKRATVYDALDKLIAKDLASKTKADSKTQFVPLSPTNLLDMAENQVKNISQAKSDIQNALPNLLSSYVLNVGKPIIQYFEGLEGIKQLFEDSINQKETIYGVLQSDTINVELLKWLDGYYKKQRVKKGIKTLEIINEGKWSNERVATAKQNLREIKVVSKEKFPFKNEINIYGDRVAIVNYRRDDTLIGVLISNPMIAESMRSWFELTWASLD